MWEQRYGIEKHPGAGNRGVRGGSCEGKGESQKGMWPSEEEHTVASETKPGRDTAGSECPHLSLLPPSPRVQVLPIG